MAQHATHHGDTLQNPTGRLGTAKRLRLNYAARSGIGTGMQEYVSKKDAATAVGKSAATITRWGHQGLLAGVRTEQVGRRVHLHLADLCRVVCFMRLSRPGGTHLPPNSPPPDSQTRPPAGAISASWAPADTPSAEAPSRSLPGADCASGGPDGLGKAPGGGLSLRAGRCSTEAHNLGRVVRPHGPQPTVAPGPGQEPATTPDGQSTGSGQLPAAGEQRPKPTETGTPGRAGETAAGTTTTSPRVDGDGTASGPGPHSTQEATR